MIRAAFFSCGCFVTLCGAALLFVDRVVLTDYASGRVRQTVGEAAKKEPAAWRLIYAAGDENASGSGEVIDPPDWGGFCLLSVGGVTLLYSLCLPGRRRDEEEEE